MKSRRTNASNDRKAAQLCAQVRRALDFGIAEVLSQTRYDAHILDVIPAPNTSHLVVLVGAAFAFDSQAVAALEETLSRNAGLLRTNVAHSIHRRKTPTLTFHVVPS